MIVQTNDGNEPSSARLVDEGPSARSASLSRRALFGLIVSVVLLLALGGCGAHSASSPNRHGSIDHRPALAAAPHLAHGVHVAWPYFRSPGDGWLLGEIGCAAGRCPALLHATRGRWQPLPLPVGVIVSEFHQYACDTRGRCVAAMTFADDEHGYLWGERDFYSTRDGGQTWTHESPGFRVEQVDVAGTAVVRLGEPSASCVRACVRVQSTRVGRLGWHDALPRPLAGSDTGLLLSAADTVTLLVTPPHESGTAQYLYRSGDGLSWRRIGGPACPATRGALTVVTGIGQAPDGGYAIACTNGTLRILSADGTQTGAAHPIPNGLDHPFTLVAPASVREVFIEGQGGSSAPATFVTNDAGAHWTPAIGASGQLANAEISIFVTATWGYDVTDSGSLLISTDAGRTWTRW